MNFDNVVDAMSIMMDDFAYGISKRRLTLSTTGVVPALKVWGCNRCVVGNFPACPDK